MLVLSKIQYVAVYIQYMYSEMQGKILYYFNLKKRRKRIKKKDVNLNTCHPHNLDILANVTTKIMTS